MTSDPTQVISTTRDHPFHSVHALSVYHRNFPKVRGEGISPEDAAARLAVLLSRTLDKALEIIGWSAVTAAVTTD